MMSRTSAAVYYVEDSGRKCELRRCDGCYSVIVECDRPPALAQAAAPTPRRHARRATPVALHTPGLSFLGTGFTS